ncbi:MAG: ABC transporter permease, partial [Chloroflexota bacterium]
VEKKIARPIVIKNPLKRIKAPIPVHLAFKEIWRNKGRFTLIGAVIALITTLVLFIAGLAEGLGAGNREYIAKLNADLILYQENTEISINSSRFGREKLREVRRVPGVAAVGSIAFSNASLLRVDDEPFNVSLIGVEPGLPGEPPSLEGNGLVGKRDDTAVIGRNVALRTGLAVGDTFTLKSVQATKERFYKLTVAGITDGRQYSIQPSIFVPYLTWEKIKPKGSSAINEDDITFNLIAVQLENPGQTEAMIDTIQNQVGKIEAYDKVTAYTNTPGYSAQQSTLNTQRIFTMIIGVLVVGGFFQIQTLQKVGQIGMLKAIGTSSFSIAIAFLIQIFMITALGVAVGALGTLALSLSFPVTIPIIFTPDSILATVVSLMLIGPIGGLISLRILLKVEPLTALGLGS